MTKYRLSLNAFSFSCTAAVLARSSYFISQTFRALNADGLLMYAKS
ncbi:MAG: hypothetical protein ACXVA2_24980 [Mucilaginibacter sp.]